MTFKINKKYAEKVLKPCKCGNKTDFNIISQQVCEDGCEIWIECGQCGHDPANGSGEHVESVMGGIDNYTTSMAIEVWNEKIS